MTRNSGPTNRNFGLNHVNGKGSKSRITDVKAFRENFESIDWTSTKKKPFLNLQELHDEWGFSSSADTIMIDLMWTLEQGIELARRLEIIAMQHNAHVALGGGVLHRGFSDKDLDIFVYPRKSKEPFSWEAMMQAFGAKNILHHNAGYPSDGDAKQVFITTIDGKQVDFFFLK